MSPECSVVIPLWNQEAALPTLHLRLVATLRRLALPYEIIYVDDGSTDDTPSIIRDLHRHDPAVKGIFLSRRFGARAALCAGIEAAAGRAVVTLDADLEDPPELIAQLMEKWQEGNQVVAVRRRDRGWTGLRNLPARLVGRLLDRLAEVPIGGDAGDFALMDRQVVEHLNALPERTRLLRGLRRWVGFQHACITYDRAPRREVRPGGWFRSRLGEIWEQVLIFSSVPSRVVAAGGVLLAGAGALGLTACGLGGPGLAPDRGPTAWLASLGLVLGGLQLLATGLIGAYATRILREVRGQPAYITRDRVGFSPLPRAVPDVVEFLPSEAALTQESATRRRTTGAAWPDSLVIQLKP